MSVNQQQHRLESGASSSAASTGVPDHVFEDASSAGRLSSVSGDRSVGLTTFRAGLEHFRLLALEDPKIRVALEELGMLRPDGPYQSPRRSTIVDANMVTQALSQTRRHGTIGVLLERNPCPAPQTFKLMTRNVTQLPSPRSPVKSVSMTCRSRPILK
jgi:hypothetical protein